MISNSVSFCLVVLNDARHSAPSIFFSLSQQRHLSPVQESSVVGAKGLPTIFKEQFNRAIQPIIKITLCYGEYSRLKIQMLNWIIQNVFAFVYPDLESALNCWIRYKTTILVRDVGLRQCRGSVNISMGYAHP